MNELLLKRIKSLIWRAGMMAVAVFLTTVADGLGGLELSNGMTAILGLILGEISKYLNTKAK